MDTKYSILLVVKPVKNYPIGRNGHFKAKRMIFCPHQNLRVVKMWSKRHFPLF